MQPSCSSPLPWSKRRHSVCGELWMIADANGSTVCQIFHDEATADFIVGAANTAGARVSPEIAAPRAAR